MANLAEQMMRQATDTAAEYMREAVRRAHETFGADYCKRNPHFFGLIVAGFMQAAAHDFDSSVRAGVVGARGER